MLEESHKVDLEKKTANIKKLKGDIAMMNIKTNGQLRDEDFKDVQISKLENQVKEMEEELNSMQVIIQNHAFEKRQLMQQIDKLEERLDKEKGAKRATLTHEAK